jgi:hypothetical protein
MKVLRKIKIKTHELELMQVKASYELKMRALQIKEGIWRLRKY